MGEGGEKESWQKEQINKGREEEGRKDGSVCTRSINKKLFNQQETIQSPRNYSIKNKLFNQEETI